MKYVLEGAAQQHPDVIGLLAEDKLVDKNDMDSILKKKNLHVERIEQNGTEKVVYIKECESNILLG